ncbi:MAG: DUF2333 family protein, partial [Bdellovibrio bacteriovorus]
MNAQTDIEMLESHEPVPEPVRSRPAVRAAHGWRRLALSAVAIYTTVVLVLGVYWSVQPARFDVRAAAAQRAGGESALVPGSTIVATIK